MVGGLKPLSALVGTTVIVPYPIHFYVIQRAVRPSDLRLVTEFSSALSMLSFAGANPATKWDDGQEQE